MAEFKNIIVTQKGLSLVAKTIAASEALSFTKIAVSDKSYVALSDTELESLEGLEGIKQNTEVTKVAKIDDNVIQIDAAISNANLETGYYVRSLGLYANDPDEGEILYGVATTTVDGWMPAFNNSNVSEIVFRLFMTVSNADKVEFKISSESGATLADIEELKEQIRDVFLSQPIIKLKGTDDDPIIIDDLKQGLYVIEGVFCGAKNYTKVVNMNDSRIFFVPGKDANGVMNCWYEFDGQTWIRLTATSESAKKAQSSIIEYRVNISTLGKVFNIGYKPENDSDIVIKSYLDEFVNEINAVKTVSGTADDPVIISSLPSGIYKIEGCYKAKENYMPLFYESTPSALIFVGSGYWYEFNGARWSRWTWISDTAVQRSMAVCEAFVDIDSSVGRISDTDYTPKNDSDIVTKKALDSVVGDINNVLAGLVNGGESDADNG